ncbi:hypothetical protein ACQCN2_19550 [Brevibacillus ginsengisoli]|uniref:hypothetical protein n=1 Tax=Brevibacillus ginsengisoli TaxID=363854 RepID=UPI003CECC74B
MQRSILLVVMMILLGTFMAGCGLGTKPIELSDQNVVLTSDPAEPKAKEDCTLSVSFKGIEPIKDGMVQVEISKKDSKRKLMDAIMQLDGTFTVSPTFAEAGTYNITIHVTTPEIHQIFERKLEVK